MLLPEFHTGAAAIFSQTAYTAHEGEVLDVCVSLNGATDIAVSIMLNLEQDDQVPPDSMATSEIRSIHIAGVISLSSNSHSSFSVGSDVDLLSDTVVTFPPSDSGHDPMCRAISVANDTIFEKTETFLVSMSTLMERVDTGTAVQVRIIDDDGWYEYPD